MVQKLKEEPVPILPELVSMLCSYSRALSGDLTGELESCFLMMVTTCSVWSVCNSER